MPSAAEVYLEKIWKVIRGKDADVPSVPVDVSNVSMTNGTYRTATVSAGTAESDAVDISEFVGDAGVIIIPGVWTAASIGFKVSNALNGLYVPLRDEVGTIVQLSGIQVAASCAYKLPEQLRGVLYFKVWSQSSGVDVNQAANRSLILMIKG